MNSEQPKCPLTGDWEDSRHARDGMIRSEGMNKADLERSQGPLSEKIQDAGQRTWCATICTEKVEEERS